MRLEPITLFTTGLPLAILAVLAVLIPGLLARRRSRSQRDLVIVICASAAVLLVLGAVTFFAVYQIGEIYVGAVLNSTWATVQFFLTKSAFAAIAWLPILGLRWFSMAQAIEKRKGEDLVQRGQND